MDGLVIRPVVESDLKLLRASFDEGIPEQPENGLVMQREGTGDLLLALLHQRPAGHVSLRWQAEPHAPKAWRGKVANLQDLIVLERYRSRGIGTEMMRVAEEMTAARGFRRLSLGVGEENNRARKLYERLGYQDAGLEPVSDGGSFRRWDGTMHEWQETWRFMVKELGPASP